MAPGNRLILERLQKANKPTFLVINKMDAVRSTCCCRSSTSTARSSLRGDHPHLRADRGGRGDAVREVLKHLPEGEPLFDEDMLTDQAERVLVSEYIREQVLRHCRQEVPYSSAVLVDVFDESEREPRPARQAREGGLAGLVRIAATIYVERDSQKAIVIGKRGADAEDHWHGRAQVD